MNIFKGTGGEKRMQAARKRNQKILGQEIRVVWRQSLTSLLVWNIYYECEGGKGMYIGEEF